MNARTNLVLLIVMSLLLAALGARNGALALMTLPFLFYLGAGLLTSPGEVRLSASRALSRQRSNAEAPINVTVVIENDGPAVPRLQIQEQVLPKMKVVAGALEQRVTLPVHERIELSYTFQASRGRYEWQTIHVVASDLFGLFEKHFDLPAAGHALILPDQPPLRRLRLRPRHTIRTVGPNLSRLPGVGIDFWGVREYRPGDSLRRIHWRLAARRPTTFFSKEFEREEMADVGLLLDARAATDLTHGSEHLFEHSVQAAAALAKSALRAGNRVSLLVLGERVVRVFPGSGKRQLVRILDQLAGYEPGEEVAVEPFRYLPVRLFPSHSLIFFISPLRLRDFKFIVRLRAVGYQVIVLSPNPVQFTARPRSASLSGALAVRTALLERAVLLRRIRQLGVEVVDWTVDQPLEKTIRPLSRAWARGKA